MGFKMPSMGRLALAAGTAGSSELYRKGFGLASKGYDKATAGPQYTPPQIDQDVLDLQKRQMQKAKDFRGGMEGARQEQFGQAEGASRAGLAKSMSGNKASYSGRGLLFSGMKQGGEADLQTESASNLAKTKADINQGLEDTASGLDQQAFESGTKIAQINSQNEAMKQQFEQTAAANRNKGIGGVLRMGSMISGGYLK